MKRNNSGWTDVKGIAKENGVGYQLFMKRKEAGMDASEAASKPPRGRNTLHTIDGMSMTKKDHCERLGKSYSSVISKMRRNNLSFEEAIKTVVGGKK